jgi:hypothetical protein
MPADAQEEKNLYGALWEGQLGNIGAHLLFRFVIDPASGANTGHSTPQSISKNLKAIWKWDNDLPLAKQLGHPYHGAYSHLAARANGFSFYEGFFFNALASISWEIAGETLDPSLNDLIITTVGGAALGEMLRRLYLEIDSPWSVLLNPVGAFDGFIRGKREKSAGGNISSFSVTAGTSFIAANSVLSFNNETDKLPRRAFSFHFGFDLVYGEPFLHHSKEPFSQFEMKTRIGGPAIGATVQSWFSLTLLSSGFLFAINPVNTERDEVSTGLSMEYDILGMGSIDSYQNALNWTLKWRRKNKASAVMLKASAGWTLFAASYYFNPREGALWGGVRGMKEYDNSYGTGANIKLHFSAALPFPGEISADLVSVFYYAIPYDRPEGGGVEWINAALAEYSFPLTPKLSLVLAGTLFLRRGAFSRYPGDFKIAQELSLSVRRGF